MSNRILKSQYTLLLILVTAMFFQSCVKHPDSPGYEYSDDMTRSQAIEAYVDYGLVADNVNDSLKQTISARIPAEGSIPYSENKNTASLNMPFNYAAGEDERIRAVPVFLIHDAIGIDIERSDISKLEKICQKGIRSETLGIDLPVRTKEIK